MTGDGYSDEADVYPLDVTPACSSDTDLVHRIDPSDFDRHGRR